MRSLSTRSYFDSLIAKTSKGLFARKTFNSYMCLVRLFTLSKAIFETSNFRSNLIKWHWFGRTVIIRSSITIYTSQISISINIFPKIRREAVNTFPI